MVDPERGRARLLEGYGPTSRDRLLRARLYEVVVLAKLAVRRVSVADPNWAQRTTALFDRCAELLRRAQLRPDGGIQVEAMAVPTFDEAAHVCDQLGTRLLRGETVVALCG